MYLLPMTNAAVYARISADQHGQGLGVARQVEDCTRRAEQLGWTVAETFVDNDVSASKGLPRPQYARMLDALRARTIDAVIVYDLDRLTRRPIELEEFMGLVDTIGVRLANVSGDVDLTTANGQMLARIKGAVAAQEARRIAERTKRQKQQRIEQGKPLGQRFRTFGYERDWTINEDEASVVREVFARSAQGESQNSITKDLIARGIKTAAGNEWQPLQTSRLLKTPKYAGFQTYQGKIVGKSSVIPALVTEAEYEAVQQPAKGAGYNTRKHLLSGILICNECKAPMTGTRVVHRGTASTRYRCETRSGGCGRVSIKGEWIEGMVNRYMSFWVIKEYREALEREGTEVDDNTDAIAALDERIEGLQAAMGTGALGMEDGIAALKSARSERTRLVKEDASRVVEKPDHKTAIKGYDALSLDEKRVVIKRAFRFIFIKPGRRVRYFDESRVSVLMTFNDKVLPGGAVNIVDYRDEDGEGTRVATNRPFNPDVGF